MDTGKIRSHGTGAAEEPARPGDGVQLVLDEGLQIAPAERMTELAKGLGLDLADALAGDRESLTYLFQGVLALFPDPEAEAEDFLFFRRQRGQRALDLRREVLVQQGVVGGARRLVLEEIAQL